MSSRVDLKLIGHAGAKRARLLRQADNELEAIITELERARAAGGKPNLSLASRLSGISRPTLYARARARQDADA